MACLKNEINICFFIKNGIYVGYTCTEYMLDINACSFPKNCRM
jgi:hypothetical protein